MDYFLVKQDSRYQNTPEVLNTMSEIDRRYINREDEHKIRNEIGLFVKSSDFNIYLDIMDRQLFLVSEKVKKVFERYDEDMIFKIIALIDYEKHMQHIYYLPIFEEVEALSEKAEYGFNKMVINKIVLDKEKIKEKKIFKLKEGDKNRIIARLDVVESLLRRELDGVAFERLEAE